MNLPFYNQWLKWQMNGIDYGFRNHKNDVCTFVFAGKTNSRIGTYKEELLNNAMAIKDIYQGPFDILYSGGIDSEIVIRVFKELGIKHNTIVVKYKDDYNYREMKTAESSLLALNIPYKVVDFDLQKFYENEAYDLCIKSSCIRAGRANHIKFCTDFCDNIPIMGEGDVYWARTHGTDYSISSEWRFIMSESCHNCNMYLTKLGRENVCDFFEFTPNLIYAFNQQSLIKQLLNDKIPGKASNWSSKWNIYHSIYPDLEYRVKLTGLEQYKDPGHMPEFIKNLQEVIENKLGPGNDYWYTIEELNQFI